MIVRFELVTGKKAMSKAICRRNFFSRFGATLCDKPREVRLSLNYLLQHILHIEKACIFNCCNEPT